MMGSTLLQAQNPEEEAPDTSVVNRDIRIEKEYIPEIGDSKRQNIVYSTQELSIDKSDITYSNYASRVLPRSNFYPLGSQKQTILKRKYQKQGYASLGFGYPINWDAEVFYPILSKGSTYLDVMLDHDGIYQNNIQLIDTKFDMLFKQSMSSSAELYATIGYKNSYYNYYGLDSINNISDYKYIVNGNEIDGNQLLPTIQSIHRAHAAVGVTSTKERNGWEYYGGLDYDMLYLQYNRAHEHMFDLIGGIRKEIAGHHLVVDLDLNMAFYGLPTAVQTEEMKNNIVLGVMPAYDMKWKNISLKVGAKLYASFMKKPIINAMPDINASYNLGKILNVYANIGGDYKINTLSSALEECRYFNPYEELTHNTYTPADFALGAMVKPYQGLSINLQANYAFVMDEHFYINKAYECIETPNTVGTPTSEQVYSNLFTAEYSDMQHLKAQARINYNHLEQYIVHAGCTYNYYIMPTDSIQAWNRPTWEIEFGTELKPIDGLSIYADLFYGIGYNTKLPKTDGTHYIKKMNDHIDLNLGASYTIKKRFTLYAKVNNILSLVPSLQYQDWYGYNNFGFSTLFGIKMSF